MSRWTNDKGAPPRLVVLKRWAMATGVPYGWLVGEEGQDGPTPSDPPIPGSGWNVPASTLHVLSDAA